MITRLVRFLWVVLITGAGLFASGEPVSAAAQPASSRALLLNAEGPLTVPMADYLERGLRAAEQRGDQFVILQLNTPGGELDLMNRMVQDISTSPLPVVVYVAPQGAIAGSAGALITMAGQAAAMAPKTAIGASSPISGSGQDLEQTLAQKQKEIMKASVRSLTSRRGQPAVSLAESMIENAKAVSAEEALQAGLVDFIAADQADLLRQLDGFKVATPQGEVTLHTSSMLVEPFAQTFIESLLGILTNPNIVVLLLNVGVIAILIEISHPGGWIAGFIGVVCLALAVYGLGILPVNWFGLIFMAVAFVLFILDIKAPTHGALTIAGIASLIVGVLVLFNTAPTMPGVPRLSIPIAIFSSAFTGLIFLGLVLFALRARKVPVRTGQESLLGRVGTVTLPLEPRGQVQTGGELWSAEVVDGSQVLPRGTRVEVIGVQGLRLLVRKIS